MSVAAIGICTAVKLRGHKNQPAKSNVLIDDILRWNGRIIIEVTGSNLRHENRNVGFHFSISHQTNA